MVDPKVSVVTPVFNAERFLPAAIESILGQTFPDFELLIIDDGSTDGSPEIGRRYQRQDARVRLLAQDKRGVSATRNLGLSQARGVYIAWLDADDAAHTERLATQAAYLDAHPETVILGSAFRQIDEDGHATKVHGMPETDTAIRWHALFHSTFAKSTVMQRLEIFREYQLAYPVCDYAEDYDLSSRMLQHGRGWNLRQALVDYRVHASQETAIKSTAIYATAVQIARRNMAQIKVDLDAGTVACLRAWYYRYPRRLAEADMPVVRAHLDLAEAGNCQPGRDAGLVREIRGRAMLQFLRAALRSPAIWNRDCAGAVRRERLAAALAAGLGRARRWNR